MTTVSLRFAPIGIGVRGGGTTHPGVRPDAGHGQAASALPPFGLVDRSRGDNDWSLRAACSSADPDALFVTGAAQRDAAKLCSGCPVKLECLADALDNRVEYGVWGGMTERQRRALLKRSPEVTSWREVLEEARTSVVHVSVG